MAKLEIIGFPISTYVRAVRMLCEEKGVGYTLVPTPPHTGLVAKIHPYGKVPVMREGKFELCESLAIASYIDQKYSGKSLFPSGAAKAAENLKWISLVNQHVYPTMIARYVIPYLFPEKPGKPDRKLIDAQLADIEKQAKLLDKTIKANGHLAGRGLTFSDLNVLPIINYVRMFPEGGEIVGKQKNLTAWFEKLTKRKSWKVTEPPAQ